MQRCSWQELQLQADIEVRLRTNLLFSIYARKERMTRAEKEGEAQHKAIMTTNHCSFQVIFLEDKHKIKDCLNCNRLGNFLPPYISSYVVEGQVTIPKFGLAPVNCKHSASNERGSSWQPWPQICCDLSLVCHLLQWPYCLPGALQWSAWILLDHLWWQSFFFPKDWKKKKKRKYRLHSQNGLRPAEGPQK